MKVEKATRGRILVVDDDPSILLLVCERLSADGFECETCSSGLEALERLQAKNFDIVISDLRMPGLTGFGLLEEVRTKYPRTAFLVITGMDDVRLGVQAMKQGGVDYLVKPFEMDALLSSVERALEMKRLEMEVENYRLNLEQLVDQRTQQLQSAMRGMEQTYDETLEVLGIALDARDSENQGHSKRVSRYSVEIAKGMGYSRREQRILARASYLHDIGKSALPNSILLKPAELTADEKTVMQAHPQTGYELMSHIALLVPAAEIVLAHQERYDGTGYPRGLAGEEIPLGARILAVADALDTMTSDQPQRPARSFSEARAEIARESGRQFDPKVVDIFMQVPDRVWLSIRQEVPDDPSKPHSRK